MMKLNNGGKLPDKFKIANQEITVIIEDSLPNNDYGYFVMLLTLLNWREQ